MKNIYKLAIFIIAYVVIINLAAMFFASDFSAILANQSGEVYETGGMTTKLGVSESVSINIVRPRWYGIIYEETTSEGANSDLYLFKVIPLPLSRGKTSFLTIHTFVLSLLLLTIAIFAYMRYQSNNKQGGTPNEQVH